MPCARTADIIAAEDGKLAQFAREGNDDAVLELFNRYELYIRLRSVQMRIAGVETEDMIQEGMIGLYSAVLSFRAEGGASFRTYAYICIKRRILSAVRSANRQKHIPLCNYLSLDDEANAQSAALTSVINLEDMIVCRENISVLRNVVENSLTASERGILNMYISGVSYAGMAEVLHVSIKSIDNSLQKIKKRLLLSFEG